MTEPEKETWLAKHSDELIVGISVTILGGIILPVVTGMGSKIYYAVFSPPTVPVKQTASESQTAKFSLQAYRLADLSASTTRALVNTIRKEHNVRELLALESGKKLIDSPDQTYSFVSPVYLDINAHEDYSQILSGRTDRFNVFYGGYFEIHKINNETVYLLGFISDEAFVNINSGSITTLTIFPQPDSERKYLLVLPIKFIKEAEERRITFDNGREVGVLDLILTNK